MTHTLAIDSVELAFGERDILRGAYIGVQTGQVSGLLGRNGSGKTCLLKIIYGVLECRYRTLMIDGLYTRRAFRKPELIRYAPQFGYVPNGLRVGKAFEHCGLDFGRFEADFPEMGKCFRQKAGTLSGGEKRLMEIYLVLAAPTKFALLDEPFSHVMPLHVQRVKDLINREKQNKGIIITDHMYRHILDIGDRIYLLADKSSYLIKNNQDLARLGYIHRSISDS